jgi:hypothetical protein
VHVRQVSWPKNSPKAVLRMRTGKIKCVLDKMTQVS